MKDDKFILLFFGAATGLCAFCIIATVLRVLLK